MPSRDEVLAAVRDMVADVLSLEREEVTPASGFLSDLGGESIDLLELSFQLEKRYPPVSFPINKLISAESVKPDAEGRLTPEAQATLRSRFPSMPADKLEADMRYAGIQTLVTVGVIADFVYECLAAQPAAAPAAQ